MILTEILNPQAHTDQAGLIPSFLNWNDPRPAREQFASAYIGGWGKTMPEWTMEGWSICYPGDPKHDPLFRITLRDETIYIYDYAWVAIVQPDGSFEINRMD
jgi:hypothetical protein